MPLLNRRLLALFAGPLLSFSATAQEPSSTDMQRILSLMAEQQKVIESLQATLADQQVKIERLEAAIRKGEIAPLEVAAAAAPAPVPAAAVLTVPEQQFLRAAEVPKNAPVRRWFEKYSFSGYTQFRHNGIVATNPDLECQQCDRSIGGGNNLAFRRARLVLSGDVNDRIYIYFQPDFASSSGNLHFGQIRDLYFDLALDRKKEFRIRAGQSKVPFGFENLQSSRNRLSLDRADAMNSAFANERDTAALFYWAPAYIRARLAELLSSGLKGSGDYGLFGAGVLNGQTANRPEANGDLHYVTRLAYPWKLKNGQFVEAGIQAYTGRYTVSSDQRSAGTQGPSDFNFVDRRVAGSFVIYPQPWGFQTEYNIGDGPEYNPSINAIETRRLHGGYAQTMYRKRLGDGQILTPFYRFQYYDGGKKQELDARRYVVRDHEFGLEWQQNPFLELVGMYVYSDRTFEDGRAPDNRQKGSLVRLQLQVNY